VDPAPAVHRPLTHCEARRRELRLTQRQLGDHPAVRIHQSLISMIERGDAWPTPEQAARIATVLGVAPDVLMQPVATQPAEAK
jgi:transcriptional regulator with XRE-family HTH domain